jgi:hypothetical protein
MGTMRRVVDEGRGEPRKVAVENIADLLADRSKRLFIHSRLLKWL